MNALVGTGALVKVALRRDRIMLPVWVYALVATVVGTAASYRGLYGTVASREEFAAGVAGNASALAMYGRVYDGGSVGGLTAWRMVGIGGALVAVLSVLLVVRHTRAEEETGRLELVGAGVVGRQAALTAGLVTAVVADVLIAAVVAAGMVLLGMPAVGSVALGLALLASGLVFAAVAAVAAQLTESARSANGIAFAVLGAAYLLRAAGDATDGGTWLSWLSPIGWAQQLRPYGQERWWVLALVAVLLVALGGTAYALVSRRDLGAGLLPTRPGPAHAAPSLRGPFALAWRLHRGLLLAWAAGFAVYGAAIGGLASDVATFVGDSQGTRDLLAKLGGSRGLVDAFLATAMSMLGIIASVYAVQAALRLRTEETGQRAEPLLATSVGRLRWVASHLAFALGGTAVLLAIPGLAAGLVHGLRMHDVGGQLPRVLGATMVQLPAVWVVVAVAVLLFGLQPRASAASWAAIAVCLLLGQLGPLFGLAQWALDVSPFSHVPRLPGVAVSATPLVWLVAVAAAGIVVGLAGFRRRDISTG
jgi:ABC-2 type transport system permease protein